MNSQAKKRQDAHAAVLIHPARRGLHTVNYLFVSGRGGNLYPSSDANNGVALNLKPEVTP
jgi:hypothetical protein